MTHAGWLSGLRAVLLVSIVLLSGMVFPAPGADPVEAARTFSPPPDATVDDGPFIGPSAPWPGSTSTVLAVEPAVASAIGQLPGDGSIVDRLVADGVSLPLGAVLLGYNRRASADPLTNEIRRGINEQVRRLPGAHIAAIVEATDVSRSTVRYHLNVLEEAGLIEGEMIRGKHRYAPHGVDLSTAAALFDGPARTVLDSVARHEPVSVTALAEGVDRAPSTVSHHLDRLAEIGLLEREQADGRVLVRLTAVGDRHLDPVPGEVVTDGVPAESSLD